MKLLRRIGISLTVLFFAVCCGAVLLFNWNAFGFKALSVPTGSMRPTIPPGSLVLMHRVPLSSLKVGDVITYTNPLTMKSTITHRIIKTYKIDGKVPAFITKGDANLSPDVPVVGGLVQGKAVWHVPVVGRVMMWSKTWTGIAILIYIPALLLTIEEIQRLTEYYKRLAPYRLFGYLPIIKKNILRQRLAQSTALATGLVIAASAIALPAEALLKSNTVSLINNHITVAARAHQCFGNTTNNNNINVNNTSTQTANSGNANSSGNTSGGSASSGNASNSNSSNTTITITNC
jgi:signal peptidase I